MILDDILAQKHKELETLRAQWAEWQPPVTPLVRRDFRGALTRPGLSLIAEFKRRSPSKGEIRQGVSAEEMAWIYHTAGAHAMSVLTDRQFFGGSLSDLYHARKVHDLPVLRKDFLIDRMQLAESAGPEGPDAVLLIAAALTAKELRALRELAFSCGQAVLVEVHNEAELDRALESGAEIIGINNRNLHTFKVSLETTVRLRSRIPASLPVVSESGIHTRDDVRHLTEAGVDAMLVGEALMTASDPVKKIHELLGL